MSNSLQPAKTQKLRVQMVDQFFKAWLVHMKMQIFVLCVSQLLVNGYILY